MSIQRLTREVSVASCGWPMAAACRFTSLASSPLDQPARPNRSERRVLGSPVTSSPRFSADLTLTLVRCSVTIRQGSPGSARWSATRHPLSGRSAPPRRQPSVLPRVPTGRRPGWRTYLVGARRDLSRPCTQHRPPCPPRPDRSARWARAPGPIWLLTPAHRAGSGPGPTGPGTGRRTAQRKDRPVRAAGRAGADGDRLRAARLPRVQPGPGAAAQRPLGPDRRHDRAGHRRGEVFTGPLAGVDRAVPARDSGVPRVRRHRPPCGRPG